MDNDKLIEEARNALWYTDVKPVPVPLVRRLGDALEAAEKELRTLRNVVKDYDTNFPCDGGCNTNDGPEETCSRHGRSPADLWKLLEADRAALAVFEKAHTPTDDEREAPTDEDWRAAHQDGGVIFAKVHGAPVPVLLMRGPYGDWHSETKRYRSADVEKVIYVYRWVPAGMQEAWASEIIVDFHRAEEPQGEPSDAQVDAAMDAFYGETDAAIAHPLRPDMRAALRAASAVTDQGENHG